MTAAKTSPALSLADLRAPVVNEDDRRWAVSMAPVWARRRRGIRATSEQAFPELVATDKSTLQATADVRVWEDFVDHQAERFEAFYADQRKSPADWSRLWRKSWWPKADPKLTHARLIPKVATAAAYRVFRAGSTEFARALVQATPQERKTWTQIGIVQFPVGDPRLACIEGAPHSQTSAGGFAHDDL